MDSAYIYQKAQRLVARSGTRDPLKIAREIGVVVQYVDNLEELLGMYTYRWKTRLMLLSSDLEEPLKRMVAAHELGHDQLHRDIARERGMMQEFLLVNLYDNTEYEANAFAAHLLVSNEEVEELARAGYDTMQIARMLSIDHQLLLIKMQEMNRLGYDLRIPMHADGAFLRHVSC